MQQWNFNENLKGNFVTLGYKTHFQRGEASEVFVWRQNNGSATLTGYNINSLELIIN